MQLGEASRSRLVGGLRLGRDEGEAEGEGEGGEGGSKHGGAPECGGRLI